MDDLLEDVCPICDCEIRDGDEWTFYNGHFAHLFCVEDEA